MTNPIITISTDLFRRNWNIITTALKGYRPARNYESFVLVEASKDDQRISLRIANDQGGLRTLMGTVDGKTSVLITADLRVAIDVAHITRVLPFLTSNVLTITEATGKKDKLMLACGTIENEVEYIPKIADDFPGEGHYAMEPCLTFRCPDFDRRLRLASSCAEVSFGSWAATVLVAFEDESIVCMSAEGARGVSRMLWKPEAVDKPTTFSTVIQVGSIDVIQRMATGYTGDITIASDLGGSVMSWQFGGITYICRRIADTWPFRTLMEEMFTGEPAAEGSVPTQQLANILGLIQAQTPDNVRPQATLRFGQDGRIEVTSPTSRTTVRGWMNGTCSGDLPFSCTLNAGQIVDILRDLKRSELIHLEARILRGRPILRIASSNEPEFLHVAVLFYETEPTKKEESK